MGTEWFDFTVNYNKKDDVLEFFQEFKVKKRFVSREDYAGFREEMKKVFYLLREEIILEKVVVDSPQRH